ncbi:MAG: molybdopterin-dependent oxidoreductase [Anaerolineaceae bacterium]
MSDNISRRDFLKLSGLGITAAAVMTGCGPSSRYVVRHAYVDMPEYNQTGVSTFYATTCQECPAGCGIIVRTQEGRAIKIEGNPNHPVNLGKICSRGLTSVQGLYNPDRIGGPQKRYRGEQNITPMNWEDAVTVVTNGLANSGKVAFLLGLTSDHLFDLVTEITTAANSMPPFRYSSLATLEGRATLVKATEEMFGKPNLPYFDISNSDVILNFGASFLETWISPLAYSRGFKNFRKQKFGKRGYLISFEPRQSLTSANADLWVPALPGSEGYLAMAIGKTVAQIKSLPIPLMYENITTSDASKISGVSETKLQEIAEIVARAEHPIAIPGGGALVTENGLQTAKAILGLNILHKNLGVPGGVYLTNGDSSTTNLDEIAKLILEMNAGNIATIFIHGTNPVFELPKSLGFTEALKKVPTVISFSSFEDETVIESDYVFPDHTGLESFGYQRVLAGSDREAISSVQPVVQPIHDTKATVDVFLAAAASVGGDISAKIKYTDEVDFLQQKITPLLDSGGFYNAPELPTFWSKWLQYGGWWKPEMGLEIPEDNNQLSEKIDLKLPKQLSENKEFHLITFGTQMGDGHGANRPWLQETPDPMTTLTWNSWIEINPDTADKLGIHDDDIVSVASTTGGESIEAVVYRYPAIRPDCVAMPFGQGHTALGRYAEGRGSNPAEIWSNLLNQAGNLAVFETKVSITPTGKRRPLARQESKAGVYGEH